MSAFTHRLLASAFGACTMMIAANAVAAAPTLAPESSAQLQKLLQVQAKQTRVVYADRHTPRTPSDTFDRLFMWNEIALDTTAIDHTPVLPGETRVFGEQYGPHRTSRALAITQIAMFEGVNAVMHKYQSYAGVAPVTGDVSVDYAIAQAAHDALVYLYPSQKPRLDTLLAEDVVSIPGDPAGLAAGQSLGVTAAQAIIALRANDGSGYVDSSGHSEPVVGGPFTPIGGVGHWSPDPVSQLDIYLGAYWPEVTPFVMTTGSQFRAPPPPALGSLEYAKAYTAVKRLGGDPTMGTPTIRTKAQTFEGVYWTYDATPNICAPARLYNQIARTIALQQGMNSVSEAARFFALVDTALADAGISAWDTKWHYQYWRPVTAIRAGDKDGNPLTLKDADWYPLGGQATNTRGPNFTPPFPSYVSGHATFGGALFEILRKYYPDNTSFTFVSDEFNGYNTDNKGRVMPYHPVTFSSLTDAETSNAYSRIEIGVHWQFDADQGVIEGNKVGDWVYAHAFQPVN